MFRETLEVGLYRERLTNAGAKPYDYVLMFKILVLQRMYNLSDEQTGYQIVDRTSFRNFLRLASGDKVPDARTVWAFREQLTVKALYDKLFAGFDKFLREKNLIMNQGVIIDGSFVEVPPPAQHSRREQGHKGGTRQRALERGRRRCRGGQEEKGQQEEAQGHGCPMDEEGREGILWLQKPREGRRQEQADKGGGDNGCGAARLHSDQVADRQ